MSEIGFDFPQRKHKVNKFCDSEATMPTPQGYRYFLGIRPDPRSYPVFQRIAAALGHPIRLDRMHLTLCVIARTAERDRFVLPRVRRAVSERPLHSFSVNLSRVVSGPHGAFARTFGRQDEIQDFYRQLTRRLLACGIEPLHRKSGLHPHVTLLYRPCPIGRLPIVVSWYPTELLLIESEIGLTRHNELDKWSLSPPRQPLLPFGNIPEECGTIAAASPARRSCA